MDEKTQRDILRLSKRALALVSFNRLDESLVFELRDAIRKAEKEMKGIEDAPNELSGPTHELH